MEPVVSRNASWLTCNRRRFDAGGGSEKGRRVAGGSDRRVEVAGRRVGLPGGARVPAAGAVGRRGAGRRADNEPDNARRRLLVQTGVEADDVEGGAVGRHRLQSVHDHRGGRGGSTST